MEINGLPAYALYQAVLIITESKGFSQVYKFISLLFLQVVQLGEWVHHPHEAYSLYPGLNLIQKIHPVGN
jgi:hypothetical protein